MNTLELFNSIFDQQDELNTSVSGDDWYSAGNDYLLAAVVEGAELFGHTDYKWWKAGENDLAQIKLELVDIMFFVVSQAIVDDLEPNECAISFADAITDQERDFLGIVADAKYLMKMLTKEDVVGAFFALGDCFGELEMSVADVYKLYVGKSVLNSFRQDNGYKDGSYVKIWGDKEDNEVLTEVCARVDGENLNALRNNILMELSKIYFTWVV